MCRPRVTTSATTPWLGFVHQSIDQVSAAGTLCNGEKRRGWCAWMLSVTTAFPDSLSPCPLLPVSPLHVPCWLPVHDAQVNVVCLLTVGCDALSSSSSSLSLSLSLCLSMLALLSDSWCYPLVRFGECHVFPYCARFCPPLLRMRGLRVTPSG